MINHIAISGAGGRMGRVLVEATCSDTDSKLSLATEHMTSDFLGLDAGILANVEALNINIQNALGIDFDILIDFTRPKATLENLEFCQQHNKAIVIGTTGFSDTEKQQIKSASKTIPIVFSPNMSIGVNLCFNLLKTAARVMGDTSDIEIIEAHHRHKIDAPSGTALGMGEIIADTLGRTLKQNGVFARHGIMNERKSDEIGFSTIRAGDIVGEHTVLFADIGERVEITHKASSRMTFAKGAVRAANWLSEQNAGLYTMQDVLGLSDYSEFSKLTNA